MMKKERIRTGAGRVLAAALAALIVLCAAGCAKENKYVNVGVEMSAAGMSLYLTNTVNGFQRISNYVFFSPSSEASLDKLRQEKQGIDITYLPAKDLGLIRAGDGLTVVFPDCFDADGGLRGVWAARDSWLEEAPNYSYKFILGLAMSADYRATHMNMSYADALESVRGVRDVDLAQYPKRSLPASRLTRRTPGPFWPCSKASPKGPVRDTGSAGRRMPKPAATARKPSKSCLISAWPSGRWKKPSGRTPAEGGKERGGTSIR